MKHSLNLFNYLISLILFKALSVQAQFFFFPSYPISPLSFLKVEDTYPNARTFYFNISTLYDTGGFSLGSMFNQDENNYSLSENAIDFYFKPQYLNIPAGSMTLQNFSEFYYKKLTLNISIEGGSGGCSYYDGKNMHISYMLFEVDSSNSINLTSPEGGIFNLSCGFQRKTSSELSL